MPFREVHWQEGMFLRPHHFQAARRHDAYLAGLGEKWDLHYNWGLRSIEIDRQALADNRLIIHSLRARLRDGTLVSVPEERPLPEISLRDAFAGQDPTYKLRVSLAVPILNLGRPNVPAPGQSEEARYLVEEEHTEDENRGSNPQYLQFRSLNLKLLLSTQDTAGYETLPVVQLQLAGTPGMPVIDESYIPPVLACDASETLRRQYLLDIQSWIGREIDTDANRVVSRGVTFESQGQGDQELIERLRILNDAYTLLRALAHAEGVPPFPAYVELCRIAGRLAIFTDARRPPDFPFYDHDDLGRCFAEVKRYIYSKRPPPFVERPFKGVGKQMEVELEAEWLEANWQLYIGVASDLSPDDCVKFFKARGQAQMKIASSRRVEDILKGAFPGLEFEFCKNPPQVLPINQQDQQNRLPLVYFQIKRQSRVEEWLHVRDSRTLAVRMVDGIILDQIDGRYSWTMQTAPNRRNRLRLTLFGIPPAGAAPASGS